MRCRQYTKVAQASGRVFCERCLALDNITPCTGKHDYHGYVDGQWLCWRCGFVLQVGSWAPPPAPTALVYDVDC